MLIGFVGVPCSGKTTTAARLFASLKDDGHNVEFVSERARLHIATLKMALVPIDPNLAMLPATKTVKLTNDDQKEILWAQQNEEAIFKAVSSPYDFIVSDSSILNALLYMSEEARIDIQEDGRLEWAKEYDVLFRAHPVTPSRNKNDPNRVHTYEQALALDAQLDSIMSRFVPSVKLIPLMGDSTYRLNTALSEVFNRMVANGFKNAGSGS